MRMRWFAAAIAGFTILWAQSNAVWSAELKVLGAAPFRAVIPQFERATGHKLAIKVEGVLVLKQQIDAGEAFDVAILTPQLIEALIKDGKIADATRANIARAGLGVVVRAGGPKPDVGSVDAFKRTLVNAKSVMYASGSAATTHIERMFERLGITEDMKVRSKVIPAGGHIGKAIVDGAAEFGLTTIPVVLETPGTELIGPFPAELQFYVNLSGGISSGSKEPEAAKALIAYLSSPESTGVITAKGLERFAP